MSPRRFQFELIAIKIRDGLDVPYEDDIGDETDAMGLTNWAAFESARPGSRFERLFKGGISKAVARVEAARLADPTRRFADPRTGFAVWVPTGTDLAVALREVRAWRGVELAYYAPPPTTPFSPPGPITQQPHRRAGPLGVGATCVHKLAGWDGDGIQFADVEMGWDTSSPELAHVGFAPVMGTIEPDEVDHGTQVLGVVLAADDGAGIVGLAPNPVAVYLSSSVEASGTKETNIANALNNAVEKLNGGDVLLVELQVDVAEDANGSRIDRLPVEVEYWSHEVIKAATAAGIVVIEAAGNGGYDLDRFEPDRDAKQMWLNTSHGDYDSSGAVIVGAATSDVPHVRMDYGSYFSWGTNFGSIVRAFAWGENVVTLPDSYGDPNLGRTSAATAVVAGVALSIQSLSLKHRGVPFDPETMYEILGDPETGTESANGLADGIGVMPNLCRIARKWIGLCGDLYVRDHVGDDGRAHAYPLYKSPDIIVRQAAVGDPQASFGKGSGTENDAFLSESVVEGRDHFVYVRIWNQLPLGSENVDATVYWSAPSTLVSPADWTEVGTTRLASVPGGDVLTVTDAIAWPAAEIPGPGSYCFVVVIGDEWESQPDPSSITDWASFRQFIRGNNNAAWRNFNVVEASEATDTVAGEEYISLDVDAPGAPDEDVEFAIALDARLPSGSRVVLEAPVAWAEAIGWAPRRILEGAPRGKIHVPVALPSRATLLKRVFPRRSRGKLRLLVRIPPDRFVHAHEIALRQLHDGFEVGRFTWRLEPPTGRTGGSS